MTAKGGTSHACAVCKYQRRKCTAECPLAPYFPADQPRRFQNSHRLFGVSNILKILDKVDASRKPEAMRSIMFEADVRDRSPVHGCLGIIYSLRLQIHHAQLELEGLHHHLAMLRQQNLPAASSSASNEHYNMSENNGFISFDGISVDGCGVRKNVDLVWAPLAAGSAANQAVQNGIMQQEYDEISPYFDVLDEDRPPFDDSKEACDESCSDSMMAKEAGAPQPAESGTESELKSAAACFTLTSVMN